MNFKEMSKLWLMLADLDIEMTVVNLLGGYQIRGKGWDVICHSWSYGHEKGLLEIFGDDFDEPMGYLTAQEAFELIEKIEGI